MRVNEITMLRECRKNISSLSGIHRKKDGSYNLELHRSALLFITDHLQGMEEKKEKKLMSPLLKNTVAKPQALTKTSSVHIVCV